MITVCIDVCMAHFAVDLVVRRDKIITCGPYKVLITLHAIAYLCGLRRGYLYGDRFLCACTTCRSICRVPTNREGNAMTKFNRSLLPPFVRHCCDRVEHRARSGRPGDGARHCSYRRGRRSFIHDVVGRQGPWLLREAQHQRGDHSVLRRAGPRRRDHGRRDGLRLVRHRDLDAAVRAGRCSADRRHHGDLDRQLQDGGASSHQVAGGPQGQEGRDRCRQHDRLSLGARGQKLNVPESALK